MQACRLVTVCGNRRLVDLPEQWGFLETALEFWENNEVLNNFLGISVNLWIEIYELASFLRLFEKCVLRLWVLDLIVKRFNFFALSFQIQITSLVIIMVFHWECSIYEFRRDNPSVSLLRSIFTWSYFWGTSFARHWSIWRKNIEKEVTWFETSI